jgi:hypothetical protein
MAVLAYASASSSCIEVCSPTSVFHVRSFAAPVSAATTTSAAICQPIPTPYGASSPRQADRLPRVIRATFPAYTRRIYVLTFRMVSGFESCGPLAQVSPPLFASCTSGRRFAYSFLQIPPRDGHPCCSASSSHHQGLQRTCTAKSTKWPPQPIRSRLRATRHAWRTTQECAHAGRTKKRRPGRIAQAVAVICGYWTKAIALPRVPRHLHIRIPALARML